ncbi:MAG: 30S ribosomal protein S6, partial [Thermodesulfobacteriota bacterium]
LVRPDISSEDLTTIQDKLTKSINSHEGEILKNEKWADRDLAYPINDYTKGSYYILEFKALPAASIELEKHLSFHKTEVLRFMTILNEDESPVKETTVKSSPSPEPKKTTTTATTTTAAATATKTTADTAATATETTTTTTSNTGFTSSKEPAEAEAKETAADESNEPAEAEAKETAADETNEPAEETPGGEE